MVNVEVIYIDNNKIMTHVHCTLPIGSTVEDALNQSGIVSRCPEVRDLPVGIFSKPVEKATKLRSGDRIEIYRSLIGDPKEKRRQRAKKR